MWRPVLGGAADDGNVEVSWAEGVRKRREGRETGPLFGFEWPELSGDATSVQSGGSAGGSGGSGEH